MTPRPVLFAGFALLVAAAATAQGPTSLPARPGLAVPPGMPRDNATDKVGTSVLAGRVVDAETGGPLRRAVVRVFTTDAPAQPRSISTDADGRWRLRDLPAGSYRISITKGGYVDIAYGQKRPFEAGTVVDLAEGQTIDKLDVAMPRAGVITGQVLDEFGDPVTGARVQPMRYRYMGGQRRLVPIAAGDTTDDIGQYRLHGLSPGEYYISASMSPGMMFGQSDDRIGYAPTYYPGTPVQGEAQRVSVSVGQETQNVNISMAPSRISTISGRAVSSSGKPIYRGVLMLASLGADGGRMMMGTSLKPDGTFSFSNVAPGEYRIQVQHSPGQDEPFLTTATAAEVGSVTVTVTDRDITDLVITTSPGGKVTGRIAFEGNAKPTFAPQTLNILAAPAEFGMMIPGGGVRVRDDWTFEATGLSGRRIFRLSMPPAGWYVKSVTYQGTDITDSGLDIREGQNLSDVEILLTQRATDLSGGVEDDNAHPVTDYAVVAFSTDSSKWTFLARYVRSARPNQQGRFTIKGLPPDEYFVVALNYLEQGEESDPEQLELWKTGATRIRLAEGEARTLTLKLRP